MTKNAFLVLALIFGAFWPSHAQAWFGVDESWPEGKTSTTATDLGYSVAGVGDVNNDGYDDVVVGMPGRYDAYLYLGSASGLGAIANWPEGLSTGSTSTFGDIVAGAGDVNNDGYDDVIIGDRAHMLSGTAHLFLGSAAGLGAEAPWPEAVGEVINSDYGLSVAGVGDVNNDGYDDVVVGSWRLNANAGRCYLYLGSASGLGAASSWSQDDGLAAGDFFGNWVAGAGDVNNDGYADVIVGAPGLGVTGGAYIFHGSASGLGAAEAWPAGVGTGAGSFGTRVASAGDVNNDGFDDVLVTDPFANSNSGLARLYLGSASGLGAAATWPDGVSPLFSANFGRGLAGVGDQNGDGYGDVVVGSPGFNSNRGITQLFLGSASGLGAGVYLDSGAHANQYFGFSIDSAGDVNTDGYRDLIVGAWGSGGAGDITRGAAYIYHSGPAPTPTPTFTQTATVSPSRTHSATVTPTATRTPTRSPTFSASPSPSATESVTASPSPSETPSPSPSATASPTSSATPTPFPSPSPSESPTVSPSPSPSPTATGTASHSTTPTVSPSASVSGTVTASPSASETATATPTATHSSTETQTATASVSATESPSPSESPTGSPSPSPSPTGSPSPIVSPTETAVSTATPTETEAISATPTGTASSSASFTETATLTSTGTESPVASGTDTPTPTPSASSSPSITVTSTLPGTATPSVTATPSLSPASTSTASPSGTPSLTLTVSPAVAGSPTPTPTPGMPASGGLVIVESGPLPNPSGSGPFKMGVLLLSGADWVEVTYYTPAYTRIKSERVQGPFGAGWSHLPMDGAGLPLGLSFYVMRAGRGSISSFPVKGRLYRLP